MDSERKDDYRFVDKYAANKPRFHLRRWMVWGGLLMWLLIVLIVLLLR